MKQLTEKIIKVEETVTKILLSFIVVLVFVAAAARWLGYPLIWSVDTAQLLFGWLCFLGANQAMRKQSHIGVDIITRYLPGKVQQGIFWFNHALISIFLIFIVVYGTRLSIQNYQRLFNTIPVSYSLATMSVPVGSLLMLYTIIIKLMTTLKQGKSQENKPAGEATLPE